MVRRIGLRRSVVFTAIAVALAVVLFVVLERTQGAALPRVAVIEATRDVQIGEPLTASALQVVYVPQDAPLGPAPALASDLALVERSAARAPIFAGEIIQKYRLYGPGLALSADPDAVYLKKGYALYTVPTAHLQMPLSGLAAGDYVAVLAALPIVPSGVGATGGMTATLQPIDMHALVTFVQADQAALTLAVPSDEVPVLHCLAGHGAVFSFAQVRPDDTERTGGRLTAEQIRGRYHVVCA